MKNSKSRRTIIKLSTYALLATVVGIPNFAFADGKTLKIGQLGVMSGAEASWGLVNKYAAEATAAMWNEKGGIDIGGEKYKIEIVSVDDRNDPKLTVSGSERLMGQEGIRYVIGPNTDVTATSVRPIAEKYNAIYFPYASSRSLFTQPAENAVMGMVASYQVAPAILELLQKERGVKKVAFVARNDSDGLSNRDDGVAAATKLGLDVVVADATYEPNVTDFFPIMSNVVDKAPDLIFLPASAPSNTPLLMRAARELGYTGLFASDSGQDIKVIKEMAGEYGDGLISIGGASTPEIRSQYMDAFIENYTKVAGEWNDEAGTKVYALEVILAALQAAGPAAIDDASLFKKQIADFSMRNPFLKADSTLSFTGEADYGQKRQIGVPLVLTETKGGEFVTISIGAVK
ncbi:ABC transporter substrate-binding protein [Pararhizobium capsulatum]|nr:ABC transporter substrate-binding protein [Pararhizobium capsulatum]